jgi:diguanylate cyclase (GGDEF)-like protein
MVASAPQTDVLTGLLTRQAFEERLRATLEQVKASGAVVSLVLLDCDNFMKVNGEFGHGGGDGVLQFIGATIQKYLKGDAFAARYGGDEFALVFPEIEREQAFLWLERVRTEIDENTTYEAGGKPFQTHITVTAGIAAYPIDGEEENYLLRKADGALYRAKMSGRNKVMLAYEERMVPKTAHFTQTQLERLAELAKELGVSDAVLLREALDDLLVKYRHSFLAVKQKPADE